VASWTHGIREIQEGWESLASGLMDPGCRFSATEDSQASGRDPVFSVLKLVGSVWKRTSHDQESPSGVFGYLHASSLKPVPSPPKGHS
jgi:hypothetical protein